MKSLDEFAQSKLNALAANDLRRDLVNTDRFSATGAVRQGRELISFSCNDYLNLSHHPEVIEAANAASRRFGTGAGASRLITGNHPLYGELETNLASWKKTEAACVFGSGYLTNLGIVPALTGPSDLILVDELSHACLWGGSRLSGAKVKAFDHNDMAHLETLLDSYRAAHTRCLIVTDGVFSMDGDLAPLPKIAAIANRYDAWLMSDDAHGLGVIGGGRGSAFAHKIHADVPLQMGTLSKSLGTYGGYLCGSQAVIDLIRNRSRTFVYSTGLPPGTIAAAIKALEIIERNPAYCARPVRAARYFAKQLELPEPVSPIVPLVLRDSARAMDASRMLEEAGFLVTAIRPPTVPEDTARLRFTFTAAHKDADILRLTELVKDRILVPVAA